VSSDAILAVVTLVAFLAVATWLERGDRRRL